MRLVRRFRIPYISPDGDCVAIRSEPFDVLRRTDKYLNSQSSNPVRGEALEP
jgi:hypothetical protein